MDNYSLDWTGERYLPEVSGIIELEHIHRYLFAEQFVNNKRVLDIACGEGYGSFLLAKTAFSVIGVDIADEAVKHAKNKYIKNNLQFKKGSAALIPLEDNSVDVVVSFETIEHHDEHVAMMQEIKRVLTDDGILIISSPDKYEYSDKPNYCNKYHVKELYREEFEELIGNYFKNFQVLGQRVVYGSALFAEKISLATKSFKFNDDKSIEQSNGVFNPLYLIAVASNNVLPLYQEVFFEENVYKSEAIAGYIKHNEALRLEVSKCKEELFQQLLDLQEKEKQLQKVLNSSSWHLTKPIRKFTKSIRKRSRKVRSFFKKRNVSNNLLESEGFEVFLGNTPLKKEYELIDTAQLMQFPSFLNPEVSIIIPIYNNIAVTLRCLESIQKFLPKCSFEIIIVNDCSTDNSLDVLTKIKGLNIISNKNNIGFVHSCNTGAAHAKGKFLHFLNNDVEVTFDWLDSILELFKKDKNVGLVGSKLIYPNGQLQEAGGIIWKDGRGWNYGRFDNPMLPKYNYVKEVDYCSGASIVIEKKLFCLLNSFDLIFVPAYYEDTDLCFKVRKAGLKVLYQPKSEIIHYEGLSNGTDLKEGVKSYQVINATKFFHKWKDELNKSHFNSGESIFLARERSMHKKILLVIDHYVPTFDKDAGSKSMFFYINFFVSFGYSVKFIGDNFAKMEPYVSFLQQIGVEVLYGAYLKDNWENWLKENGKYINIVFISRPHIFKKYIDTIRQSTQAKVLFYGHDLHYLRTMREYNIKKDKHILKQAKKWEIDEFKIMENADVVFYPSEYEISEIKKKNNLINAHMLPLYIYERKKFSYNACERKDIFFVGGFSHIPNVDGIVWFCKEIFPIVLSEFSDIKLYIIGSNAPEEVKSLGTNSIYVKGYITDEELSHIYSMVRLFVSPLRFGAGVKGKILESLYRGVPVVTTSIGAEGITNDSDILTIADSKEAFSEAIIKLYSNYNSLNKMSENSMKFIQSKYSVEKVQKLMKEIL